MSHWSHGKFLGFRLCDSVLAEKGFQNDIATLLANQIESNIIRPIRKRPQL